MSKIISDIEQLNADIVKKLSVLARIEERKLVNIQSELERNYKRALNEIKNRLAYLYEKLNDPNNYYSDAYSFNRLKILQSQIAQEVASLKLKDAQLTSSSIKDFYSSSYYDTSRIFETSLSDYSVNAYSFAELPKAAIESIVDNSLDKITWQGRSVENIMQMTTGIRDEITQGLIQGKSLGQVTKAITDQMNIGVNKAYRIVSTETSRAQNTGRIKSFDESENAAALIGMTSKRVWLHSDGVREPRASHVKMNETFADPEGFFYFPSGVKTKAPTLSGDPAEDIWCHCHIIMRFEGF